MGINRIATDGSGSYGQAPDGGGHSSAHSQPDARGHTDGSEVSALASALSILARLQQDDPDRFRLVVTRVANLLREGGGTTPGARTQALHRLAERFDEAARLGTLTLAGPADNVRGPPGDHLPHGVHSYGASRSWSERGDTAQAPDFDLAGAIETALGQHGVR